MHASGGIVSTVNDLAKWLKANINQESEALSEYNVFEYLHNTQVEQNKEYFTYKRSGYSLGWDIAEYNSEKLLTRFGNYGGYSIHVSFMPKRKLGVIAFTNQDVAHALPHVIANYAYNSMLNKDEKYSLFLLESQRLSKSIDRELAIAPDSSQLVTENQLSPRLLGTYENNQHWPSKKIFIDNGQAKVTWGNLTGLLLKVDGEYKIHFGSLQRPLTVINESKPNVEIKNGSLVYRKT